MGELSDKLKRTWHHTMPVGLIFILLLLEIIPYNIAGYTGIKPDLIVIAIFYWSVHRPSFMPPVFSFSLGLVLDLLSGFPIGLNALIFVVIQKFVSDQRKIFMGQPYWVSWIGFAVINLGAMLVKLAVMYLIAGALPDMRPLIVTYGLTLALFPLVTRILIASHKLMAQSENGNM